MIIMMMKIFSPSLLEYLEYSNTSSHQWREKLVKLHFAHTYWTKWKPMFCSWLSLSFRHLHKRCKHIYAYMIFHTYTSSLCLRPHPVGWVGGGGGSLATRLVTYLCPKSVENLCFFQKLTPLMYFLKTGATQISEAFIQNAIYGIILSTKTIIKICH